MIGQLIWKEWREHRWKLATLLGVVLMPMLVTTGWYLSKEESGFLLVFGCLVMPIWIGEWTATGERSRGTQGMLTGLPVRAWMVFGVKSLWGLATMLLPLAIGMAYVETMGWGRGMPGMMWCGLMTATSLYLMIVVITAGIRKEGMAAMVGLLVVLGSGLWIASVGSLESPGVIGWTILLNPFFALWGSDHHGVEGIILPIQGVVALIWWVIGAWRFGKQGQTSRGWAEARSNVGVDQKVGPRRFLLGAMIWREWREQRGLVMAAGLAAVGMAMFVGIADSGSGQEFRISEALRSFVESLFFMVMIVPTVVGVILGVGSMAGDLEPRLMGFWRSQPMRAGPFFWSKYIVALSGIWVLLIVLFAAAMAGIHVLALDRDPQGWSGLNALKIVDALIMLTVVAGWVAMVLTVTMFLYVLIRRAIYVVVLAAGMLWAILAGIGLWMDHYPLREARQNQEFLVGMLAMGVIVTVGLAVLTQVALGRDWRVGRR